MKWHTSIKQWFARGLPGPQVRVREVDNPTERAKELFFQNFRQQAPITPKHFILETSSGWLREATVLGYVHYEAFGDSYLAGGLVVDAWRFRKLSTNKQAYIHNRGGLAECLMTESCNSLSSSLAIYAYIGDKRSRKVLLRVGFKQVPDHEYLYVLPKMGAGHGELLATRTESVKEIGPF